MVAFAIGSAAASSCFASSCSAHCLASAGVNSDFLKANARLGSVTGASAISISSSSDFFFGGGRGKGGGSMERCLDRDGSNPTTLDLLPILACLPEDCLAEDCRARALHRIRRRPFFGTQPVTIGEKISSASDGD